MQGVSNGALQKGAHMSSESHKGLEFRSFHLDPADLCTEGAGNINCSIQYCNELLYYTSSQ